MQIQVLYDALEAKPIKTGDAGLIDGFSSANQGRTANPSKPNEPLTPVMGGEGFSSSPPPQSHRIDLHPTTKPIPLPRELCFAHRPIDTLDAGSPVYVIAELPHGLLPILSLAGPLVVERDCVEWDATGEGEVRA